MLIAWNNRSAQTMLNEFNAGLGLCGLGEAEDKLHWIS